MWGYFDWGEAMTERIPSISAIGEALVVLDRELNALAEEEKRLIIRRQLVSQKQMICQETITQLLIKANGGKYPDPAPYQRFPSLS